MGPRGTVPAGARVAMSDNVVSTSGENRRQIDCFLPAGPVPSSDAGQVTVSVILRVNRQHQVATVF